MNETEKVVVTVWRRDSEFWIIPLQKYAGIVLNRHSFERMQLPIGMPDTMFNQDFARLNATPCARTEARYVLRKLYAKYNPKVSLVLE